MNLKIEGCYRLRVAPQVAYRTLQDETLLRAAMPGGLHFARLSPTTFEAAMEIALPREAEIQRQANPQGGLITNRRPRIIADNPISVPVEQSDLS